MEKLRSGTPKNVISVDGLGMGSLRQFFRTSAILGFCVLIACSGGDEASPQDAEAEEEEIMNIARRLNSEVLGWLDSIKKNCDIDEKTLMIGRCKNDERRGFTRWIKKSRPKDLLLTIANLLIGKVGDNNALIIRYLPEFFELLEDKGAKQNAREKGTYKAFVLLLKGAEPETIPTLATYATYVATLSDNMDEFNRFVQGQKSEDLTRHMYRSLMRFGRWSMFKKIQQVAELDNGKYFRDAVESVSRIDRFSRKEHHAICPWLKSAIGHKDDDAAYYTAKVMLKCGDRYIPSIINEGKKRVRKGKYGPPFSNVFGDICRDYAGLASPKKVQKRCKPLFKFLTQVINNGKLKDEVRAQAIGQIVLQKRDKQTVAMMRRLQRHKVFEIRQQAKEALRTLTQVYGFR